MHFFSRPSVRPEHDVSQAVRTVLARDRAHVPVAPTLRRQEGESSEHIPENMRTKPQMAREN